MVYVFLFELTIDCRKFSSEIYTVHFDMSIVFFVIFFRKLGSLTKESERTSY